MSIVVDEEQFNEDNLEDNETFDNLEHEEVTSNEALDDLEESVSTLPDKFKGKSVEDVANSYMELEKEFGRKNNEVGELRKLTDDFLKQQLETPTEQVTGSNVDLDDLLENPSDVISKIASKATDSRISALEDQLKQARVAEQKAGFESKHEDWQDVLNSGDFQSWIKDSPVRQNMFQQANDKYDYAMADELFNLYRDLRGVAKETAEGKAVTKRKKALRNTSGAVGGTGEVSRKVFKRADLVRLKQTNPTKYNEPSFQKEILLAYSEGRVR